MVESGWTKWLTQPLDATNFTGGSYFCDFFAGGYRLPTEGEWEYFCRAGSTHPFGIKDTSYSAANCDTCTPAGLEHVLEVAVFCANSGGQPAAVASKNPNNWGLYDVHGNVAEWCQDLQQGTPRAAVPATARRDGRSPQGLVRGGAGAEEPGPLASSAQLWLTPLYQGSDVGIRAYRPVQAGP